AGRFLSLTLLLWVFSRVVVVRLILKEIFTRYHSNQTSLGAKQTLFSHMTGLHVLSISLQWPKAGTVNPDSCHKLNLQSTSGRDMKALKIQCVVNETGAQAVVKCR
uniref:Uncharacterized protein n=1 Tax=Neolamprologus brichardi TaxID=32507 RepID=A0A3Q4HRC5_NEOBR